MILRPLQAIVAKDLLVFISDRHSVVLAFLAPVALASLMAVVFGGGGTSTPARIKLFVVDEDKSVISRAIIAATRGESRFVTTIADRDPALTSVRRGDASTAIIIPQGFGDQAADALLGDGDPPDLPFHFDPTHQAEARMAQGLLTRMVLESVAADSLGGVGDLLGEFEDKSEPRSIDQALDTAEFIEVLGGKELVDATNVDAEADRAEFVRSFPGLGDLIKSPSKESLTSDPKKPAPTKRKAGGVSMPYIPRDVSIIAGGSVGEQQALAAHSFSGMIVQFVLFSAVEWGVCLLVERQRGIWKRMRVTPISRLTMLGGKVIGCMIVSMTIIAFVFTCGGLAFGYRVQGSFVGLLSIALAFSWVAATLGLLVAALGRSPQGARSVSVLCVLVMVMLGGGWIPSFLFPEWLQSVTPIIPTRWAVDGFDGVVSRGFSLAETRSTLLALFGFGALFAVATLAVFRWEEEN